MKRLFYYFKLWLMMSRNSFMVVLSQKTILIIFLIGKVLRFGFFFGFLFLLLKNTGTLLNYTANQVIFFFLTFNLVDVISQFLFREVYRFRNLIIKGDFDLVLTKPQNSLFRVLLGGADVIDFITIPPLIFAVYYVGSLLNPNMIQTIFYLIALLNGFLIATAFHIAVLSLGIITLEIDHTIMIYRDLSNLGRFPIDIYKQPLQGILTYLVPVGIMFTFPVKVLIGLVSPLGVLLSFGLGIVAIFLSLRFWNFALTKYTSASS
jgi:ABC-2 type transport system permease protein